MTYEEIKAELNDVYKETVKKKNEKFPANKNSNTLLENELTYGPHGKHNEIVGDNVTGHHMPSNKLMQDKFGIPEELSHSINLEQIVPGTGGRHRRTFTYGISTNSRKYQLYSSLTPRDALAFDVRDLSRILKEDGLYNKETRQKLKGYIDSYKSDPNAKKVFEKTNKNSKTVACLKK